MRFLVLVLLLSSLAVGACSPEVKGGFRKAGSDIGGAGKQVGQEIGQAAKAVGKGTVDAVKTDSAKISNDVKTKNFQPRNGNTKPEEPVRGETPQ
ncbi:MAG: hypothetical protein KIT73_07455 [Burkholderiales bacterium]|nr:hypothetical protein [Burkholderiales bacterium]